MRINMDCIRDILLCVEENTGLRQRCFFVSYAYFEVQEILGGKPIAPMQYQLDLESRYDNDELIYHLKYCMEAGMIVSAGNIPAYQNWIADLTPKGHDFIANIRSNSVWEKVKKACIQIGISSIDVIPEVAKSYALQTAAQFLGLS